VRGGQAYARRRNSSTNCAPRVYRAHRLRARARQIWPPTRVSRLAHRFL